MCRVTDHIIYKKQVVTWCYHSLGHDKNGENFADDYNFKYWCHQVIASNNVDFSASTLCGIHLRTIFLQMPKILIGKPSLKIMFFILHPHLISGKNYTMFRGKYFKNIIVIWISINLTHISVLWPMYLLEMPNSMMKAIWIIKWWIFTSNFPAAK